MMKSASSGKMDARVRVQDADFIIGAPLKMPISSSAVLQRKLHT
jgi:hypothetical protein